MYSFQDDNKVELTNQKIALPEGTEFYVRTDKVQPNLITQDQDEVKISRSLREVVENSDLFREEDKRRFTFE